MHLLVQDVEHVVRFVRRDSLMYADESVLDGFTELKNGLLERLSNANSLVNVAKACISEQAAFEFFGIGASADRVLVSCNRLVFCCAVAVFSVCYSAFSFDVVAWMRAAHIAVVSIGCWAFLSFSASSYVVVWLVMSIRSMVRERKQLGVSIVSATAGHVLDLLESEKTKGEIIDFSVATHFCCHVDIYRWKSLSVMATICSITLVLWACVLIACLSFA